MASPTNDDAPLSLVGKILVWVFLLSIASFLISGCDWVRRLDQPPGDCFRVPLGAEWTLNHTTDLRSIQGLHRTEAVVASLTAPKARLPYFLKATDTNSEAWGDTIKVEQLLIVSAAKGIDDPVVLRLTTRLPDDPVLVGQTAELGFIVSGTLPRQDPSDRKRYVEEKFAKAVKVQIECMPRGHLRIYQKVVRISLTLAGLAVLIGIVRAMRGERRSAFTDQP